MAARFESGTEGNKALSSATWLEAGVSYLSYNGNDQKGGLKAIFKVTRCNKAQQEEKGILNG